MNKTKVIVVQNSFSIYRQGIFNRLNERYNFRLLHSKTNSGIKQIERNYSRQVGRIKYARKNTAVYLFCLKEIFQFKPDIIIHEFTPSILSLFVIVGFRKILNYKLILWGHGYNRSKKIKRHSLTFILRKWLINRSDAILFYSYRNKEIINNYIPNKKSFIAYNSLDTARLNIIYNDYKSKGKECIKEELGIKYKYILIFIGRLLNEKVLPNYFMGVVKNVLNAIENTGVFIIGDGPSKNEMILLAKKNNINNIHFLGSINDNKLSGKYLYISDLLLIPGYVGLAVNHAFSFNLPVITYEEGLNGPFHSPEIEYVVHKKTGYLAKPFDTEDMSNFIIEYLQNPDMQVMMKNEIQKCILEKCNINNMMHGFVECIDFCNKEK